MTGSNLNEPIPAPAGYMINRMTGLTGTQGIAYDYILAGNGLLLQAQSRQLTARILIAPAIVRSLPKLDEKLSLRHGPIPAGCLTKIFTWFREDPDRERYAVIRHERNGYEVAIPEQQGSRASLTYTPTADPVMEIHSHGSMNAYFSATDDQDEQGFHLYGVIGNLNREPAALQIRTGIYGYFRETTGESVFQGPPPTGIRIISGKDAL